MIKLRSPNDDAAGDDVLDVLGELVGDLVAEPVRLPAGELLFAGSASRVFKARPRAALLASAAFLLRECGAAIRGVAEAAHLAALQTPHRRGNVSNGDAVLHLVLADANGLPVVLRVDSGDASIDFDVISCRVGRDIPSIRFPRSRIDYRDHARIGWRRVLRFQLDSILVAVRVVQQTARSLLLERVLVPLVGNTLFVRLHFARCRTARHDEHQHQLSTHAITVAASAAAINAQRTDLHFASTCRELGVELAVARIGFARKEDLN